MAQQRIGILVVAYNAASTLATVLDRIPHDFRGQITKILVGDDASRDSTHLVALGYQQLATDMPIEVVRHAKNLGYGGNQKAGYQWAIDHDLDIVVLLHGDGQYAPELLPELVAPLMRNEADAVFGSRMLDKGGARRGGMPMYKFVGNRILTRFENVVAGVSLSEWHSGYRAYSVAALRDVPFHDNHDGFDFDTQVILQLIEAGKRIVEVPIPTYYGDEISHVNGIGYAPRRDLGRAALSGPQDGVRERRTGLRQRRVRPEGGRRELPRRGRRAGWVTERLPASSIWGVRTVRSRSGSARLVTTSPESTLPSTRVSRNGSTPSSKPISTAGSLSSSRRRST